MIQLLQDKRMDILRIMKCYGVHNVRVFGSCARAESDIDSDVDFLVDHQTGFTLMKQAALERELKHLLGRKVDIVSEKALRPRIRQTALAEARLL